jgi:HEAT repeat protein
MTSSPSAASGGTRRYAVRTLVSMAACVAFLCASSASAQYGATGVYYDYSQVTLGGRPQFVLMPRGTDAFQQNGPIQITGPAAFRVLRDNKRATYGNASLTMSDADLERGRVVVHIDPEQTEWQMIVVAETVYTFTELGLTEVVFPSIREAGWTRDDVPFLAYVLHAPMWRALQGEALAAGMVEFPDGSLIPAGAFYGRWADGDRELQRALLTYLSDGSSAEQAGTVVALTQHQVPGAPEAVLPLLDSPDAELRVTAVQYLATTGEAAILDRLAVVMSDDESPEVRQAAAAALGGSGDAHFAFFEMVHSLEGASVAEMPGILGEIAATGDPRASGAITEYVSHSEEPVRQAAIDALITLGGMNELFRVLDGETPLFIRLQVGESIAAQRDDEDRVRALAHLVGARDGAYALDYLDRLVAESSGRNAAAARTALEGHLGHEEVEVRRRIAVRLGEIGAAESIEPLASAAASEGDAEVQQAMESAAVAIMTNAGRREVETWAQSRDLFVQRAAYVALGRLAAEGGGDQATFRTLQDGLSAREPGIRGAAVLGIATYADDAALEAVLGLRDDSSAQVRRDVADGLGHFQAGQGTDALMALAADSDDLVIAAALESLGERGEAEALPLILDSISASSPRVRAASARAAADLSFALASPEQERAIIDRLMGAAGDSEDIVRGAAAVALSRFDNELAILGISPLTQDRSMTVRLQAIEALGENGGRAALGVLVSLLEDREATVRAAAIEALGDLGNAEAASSIRAMLPGEEDPGVQAAAERTLNRLGGGQ